MSEKTAREIAEEAVKDGDSRTTIWGNNVHDTPKIEAVPVSEVMQKGSFTTGRKGWRIQRIRDAADVLDQRGGPSPANDLRRIADELERER